MALQITKVLRFAFLVISGYCFIAPIFILIVGINEVIRFLLKIIILIFYPKYELIGDGVDNLFLLQIESPGGIMLGVVATSTTKINLDQERDLVLTQILQKRSLNGKILNEKLETILFPKFGYGCRQKVDLDISNHVRIWTETGPSNGEFFTKTELLDEIIPQLSQPFQDTAKRPAWELVIIPSVLWDGQICTLRIFRVHHAYMDGISLGLIILEGLMKFESKDGLPSVRPPFILDPRAKLESSVKNRIFFKKVLAFLSLPYYLAVGLLSSYSVPDPVSPKGSTGLKHYGVSKKMEFRIVRDIARERGDDGEKIRIRSVFASMMVSAIGQVLQESGKLPPKSKLGIGTASTAFPYNSGPKNKIVPCHFYPHLKASNKIQLIDITPTLQSDILLQILLPLERLPLKIIQLLAQFVCGKFPISTMFTSVPGTREKGFCASSGQVVADLGGWPVITQDLGLSVVVISYGDEVRFWVTVDDAVMKREEFDRFLEILSNPQY